ncbi:hypothetical protein KEM54_000290 [Ascosphaera aggregata]|nr:hypothetical protein KEM54_000290 [Ascosphaera aggregata]
MSGLPSAPPFGAVPPAYGGQQWTPTYPANVAGQAQTLSSFPQQQNSFSNSYAMPNSSFIPGLNSQPPQPLMPAPPFPYSAPPLPYHAPPIPTGPASHQNFRQHPPSFIPHVASLPPPPPIPVTSAGGVPGPTVPTGPRRSQPSKKPHGNKNLFKATKPVAAVKAKSIDEREEGELSGDEEHITSVTENAAYLKEQINTDGVSLSYSSKPLRGKNDADMSQGRDWTPRTQVKLQAQEALRSLHTLNIKYGDMVKEGVDKVVLRHLYENAGIEVVLEEEPFNPPLAPKALLVPPVTSSVAKSQTTVAPATDLPAKPSTIDKTVASSVPAATESAVNKPMERKDVIARMLALKSKKHTSTSNGAAIAATSTGGAPPTETAVSLPSSVPAQLTALLPKEPKQKEVNKAQTELARQRIEELKKRASVPKSDASVTTAGLALSTPEPEKPQQTPISLPTATSTQLPLRPASSAPEPEPEPVPAGVAATNRTCIPGLFMTADVKTSAVRTECTSLPPSAPDTSLPPKPPVIASAAYGKPTDSSNSEPTSPSLTTTAPASEYLASSLTPASVCQSTRKRPRAVDFNEDTSESRPKRPAGLGPLMNVPEYEPKVIIDISDDDLDDNLDYGDNVAVADISGGTSSRASAIASDGSGDITSYHANHQTNNHHVSSGSGPPSRSSPISAIGSGPKSAKSAPGSDTYLKELMELKKRIAMFEEKKKEKKAQLTASGETTPALIEKQFAVPENVTREVVQSSEQTPIDSDATVNLGPASETKTDAANVTPLASITGPADITGSQVSKPSSEASLPNNPEDYRKSVLRKKVISSGLSALKSRIAENERRRAEMRKQEEALAAEIQKERAREMRLLEELEALEQIATSTEQAQATSESAPTIDSHTSPQVDTHQVEQRLLENQNRCARACSADGADITTVDQHEEFVSTKQTEQPHHHTAKADSQTIIPSAVDSLIRESGPPPTPAAAQAETSSSADERADLDDESMEESSGEGSIMDESASIASENTKKAQSDYHAQLPVAPIFEREGSYSPPEEVRDIQTQVAGADSQVVGLDGKQAGHQDVDTGAGANAALGHNVSSKSTEVDIEMQDSPQSAQQTQTPEDVEMQDGDASSQSDGYEPADIMPESDAAMTAENDSYEPPEPEVITQAVRAVDSDTGHTAVLLLQNQQQAPGAADVDLGGAKQTFDELTWTQQSTPSPSIPADTQVGSIPVYMYESVKQLILICTQEPTTTYEPIFYTPYVTPLCNFRAYRFHPDFLNRVTGGFRSLTYSNQIDPNKELCGFELSGGVCNDKTCQYQHLADMALSDENILLQLGHYREGRTHEDKERYVDGLKTIVTQMRESGVKDFETVAKGITAYRRRFLQDDTRVLTL